MRDNTAELLPCSLAQNWLGISIWICYVSHRWSCNEALLWHVRCKTPIAEWFGMRNLESEILKTLLYYDIWQHPLTAEEIYAFLPVNSMSFEEFVEAVSGLSTGELIRHAEGYYFVSPRNPEVVRARKQRERHARMMWRAARFSTHIIKRFPFVRAVFVSGDLSKNSTGRTSDVDFFILTAPSRLWICRILLTLFKKTILFNRKKFFCINYFATTDHLSIEERNIFVATEIAHLKPLYNSAMYRRFYAVNLWVKDYFPNFDHRFLFSTSSNDRESYLQKVLELPFRFLPADKLDDILRGMMARVWARRYPQYDAGQREQLFRSTPGESRAFAGNFQQAILARYTEKLEEFEVLPLNCHTAHG
jgi:hypothetical protein